MYSPMRILMAIVIALTVVSCSEYDDVTNPGATDESSLQKKPTSTTNGPTITSVSPGSAEIGDEIVITGKNFGPQYKYASCYVLVNGIKARAYALWSKTEIRCTVPSGSLLTTGTVTVVVNDVASNEVTFTIDPSSPITIGGVTWAGANLAVTTYRNGDPITFIPDSVDWANATEGAYCYYDGDPTIGTRCGILYNWYAVNDPRGLAPAGQRIPTDADWTDLAVALGASYTEASQANGFFGTAEGGKLKELESSLWSVPNEGATNSSGFTALPTGFRSYDGHYFGIMYYGNSLFGLYGYYWTGTEYSADSPPDIGTAWFRGLSKEDARIFRGASSKRYGFAVRTIMDAN